MKLRVSPVLASLLVLTSLLACSKPAPPAVVPAPPPVVEIASVHGTAPMPVAAVFDTKIFPGTFVGTLPCPDCAGVLTQIEIKPDGTFGLTEAFEGRKNAAPTAFTGTWTAEDNGTRLLLDPDSKSEPDRSYTITWPDTITVKEVDGKAVDASRDYRLHRTPATP